MNTILPTYNLAYWLFPIMMLLGISISAQELTTSQVLAPLHKANFNINYGDQLNFLLNNNQEIPILDKLEFRTETDEMNFNRQEYLFRSSFNNFPGRKIQKEINSNNVAYYQLKDQQLAEIQLEDQYQHIVDWYYNQHELDFVVQEIVIAKDRLIVLKKMVATSQEIDLVNVLKLESEILELQRDQLRINNEIKQNKEQIFRRANNLTDKELVVTNWISMDKMLETLTLSSTDSIPSTKQQLQANRLEEAELAYSFENAERRKILDFVQVKYAGRETEFIKNEISFGAGINIPTPSSERRRMNESQIEIFDEEFKARLLQHKIKEEVQKLLNEFNNIQAEYKLVEQQEKQQDLSNTLESYKKSGLAQPLSLLKINESILDYRKTKHNLERKACEVYIEAMIAQGKINILSNINYLTNDMATF